MATAHPSTSTAMPQIWFSLGGMGKPETSQSSDTLFYHPDAPWPEFLNHVRSGSSCVDGIIAKFVVTSGRVDDSCTAEVKLDPFMKEKN